MDGIDNIIAQVHSSKASSMTIVQIVSEKPCKAPDPVEADIVATVGMTELGSLLGDIFASDFIVRSCVR